MVSYALLDNSSISRILAFSVYIHVALINFFIATSLAIVS